MPTEDVEAEEMALGAILNHPSWLDDGPGLISEQFTSVLSRTIYGAVLKASKAQQSPFDFQSVIWTLEDSKESTTATYAKKIKDIHAESTQTQYSSAVKRVIQLWQARGFLSACEYGATGIRDGVQNLHDHFEKTQNLIYCVETKHPCERYLTGLQAFDELVASIKERAAIGEEKGVSTGFRAIDDLTGGWHPSDLTVLAGRPSMGKSALAMNFALNCVAGGKGVIFFSLEMNATLLAQRMVSDRIGVPAEKFLLGAFSVKEAEALQNFRHVLEDTERMTILDYSGITTESMRRNVRKCSAALANRDINLGLVVIDFLQIVRGMARNPSREREITEMTQEIKSIARDFRVPILLLSQLNRKCEERDDKRPMMSDLRDSGSIEQIADVVMMLYRDSVYKKGESDDKAEIAILKSRNGKTGVTNIQFDGSRTRFVPS